MEQIYIFFVTVLIVFAISDLVVGVSNDAVNFLISALGSRAATFKTIMIVASIGVIIGATFSSGMMEVARKGIFHPDKFYFSEIMVIFLAVMLTDVILLDLFNTFGLPTSTTVSIVFELLGGAVAVSWLKISANDGHISELPNYINTDKAMAIIAGILLSVFVAFTIGVVVMYLARAIFTFDVIKDKKIAKFISLRAVWGGIAITAITYFILIKGLKGSSYASLPVSGDITLSQWIKENAMIVIGICFVIWTIILQLVTAFSKYNILKFIVLVGTFALAMAFAGNDLVNFIGVPLAGLKSYQNFIDSGLQPDQFTMEALREKIATPTIYLIIAGLIMVVTLWLSKKARSVTETSIDLSRQSEGYERFKSSVFSRVSVRFFVRLSKFIEQKMPPNVLATVEKRFDSSIIPKEEKEKTAFDLIRASVNLVVASILIAFATSLKLPLSTTYVTFMVAMGTSLADGAWGRESAVYRITGVISVIGGWFVTAIVAFSISFIFALIISNGGLPAVIVIVLLAIGSLVKSRLIHKKREKEKTEATSFNILKLEDVKAESVIFEECTKSLSKSINKILPLYGQIIEEFSKEKRRSLKQINTDIQYLNHEIEVQKNNLVGVLKKLEKITVDTSDYYVQVIEYLHDVLENLYKISQAKFNHVDNNHKPFLDIQYDELRQLSEHINWILTEIIKIINDKSYHQLDVLKERYTKTKNEIDVIRKNQIIRIKADKVSTKNSVLFMKVLSDTKNLVDCSLDLAKAQGEFCNHISTNCTQ